MRYRFLLTRRWVAAHVLVALAVSSFVALGLWQLQRLEERRDANARIASRLSVPAEPVERVVAAAGAPAGVAYRPAVATGTYDPAREVTVSGRVHNKLSGYHVLTPLVLEDGRAILVDRGWVPLRMRAPRDPAAAPPPGRVTVEGLLFPSERRGRFGPRDVRRGPVESIVRIDVDRLRPQMPYTLHPVWLQLRSQEPSSTLEHPIPAPPPRLDEGPHRSYALQWFAFALAASATYGMLIRRSASGERAPPPPPPPP